jgi:DNA-binding transcriptional regulator PaaX
MMNRFYSLARRTLPWLGAGVLVQAGSCTPDAIFASVATSVANSLISSLVFGAFNLAGP